MIFTLHNSQQAHTVLKDLWPKIKETLQAGKQLRLEVKKANRSNEQNDMFHALIDQITKAMKVAGSDWDAECWKRLLIDAWANDTGRKIGRVVPSLDGQRVVQLGVQSHIITRPHESRNEHDQYLHQLHTDCSQHWTLSCKAHCVHNHHG